MLQIQKNSSLGSPGAVDDLEQVKIQDRKKVLMGKPRHLWIVLAPNGILGGKVFKAS